jgi:hypothetical protein
MSRVVKVVLTLTVSGEWLILVTKEYSPEEGGGEHTFFKSGGYLIHDALLVASGIVLEPANKPVDSMTAKA